jgi:hypothetical protein
MPSARHQIHDARRVTVRVSLRLNSLVFGLIVVNSSNGRSRYFVGSSPLIISNLTNCGPRLPPACFAVNPHAVSQSKPANDFGRDENVLRRLPNCALDRARIKPPEISMMPSPNSGST